MDQERSLEAALTPVQIAAKVLDEWAEAIRLDWGSIDGRGCRAELQRIAAQVRGETSYDLTQLRARAGICLAGGGHWPDYCDDFDAEVVKAIGDPS